jgi:hypothetical protein
MALARGSVLLIRAEEKRQANNASYKIGHCIGVGSFLSKSKKIKGIALNGEKIWNDIEKNTVSPY